MKNLDAPYENGVIWPSGKVSLRPDEDVCIVVITRPSPDRWDLTRLAQGTQEETALTEQSLAEWMQVIDAA